MVFLYILKKYLNRFVKAKQGDGPGNSPVSIKIQVIITLENILLNKLLMLLSNVKHIVMCLYTTHHNMLNMTLIKPE